jgi:ubiquinone/menaquinone biosynthesis C-methylase UbiE
MNNWIYDEFKHCGVDYSDINQAEIYDQQHQKFRNYEKEFSDMMDYLSLGNTRDMTLIDLGCGTGAISIYASQQFKKIYAVDVSEVMINQAQRKIATENIHNIEFVNSGFLSYQHQTEPADLVLTKAAFHHLPDFWKQIALLKINKMLKPGGILYINDIIFTFKATDYITKINDWISGFEMKAGQEFKAEVETHIRDEFSTFHWVIEGMLAEAGFHIEKSRTSDGFVAEYVCKKIDDIIISEK